LKALIVDVLGAHEEGRKATLDVIGAGPRSIASVLRKKGVDVDLIPYERIDQVEIGRYDILLVSAMTSDLPVSKKIVEKWNKFNKVSIAGGPIACDPIDPLIRAKFRICVIGEGEETLSELIDSGFNSLDKICGLAYLEGGEMRINPLRPIMPRKIYDSYEPLTNVVKSYPFYWARRVYVEVVRGCSNFFRTRLKLPNGRECNDCDNCRSGDLEDRYNCPQGIPPGCGFCSVPSTFGPPRSRSVEKIVKEIEGLLREGCKRIVLSGSDILDYGRDLLVDPKPLTNPREPEPNYDVLEELFTRVTELPDIERGKAFISIENVKACLVTEKAAKLLGKYFRGATVHIGCETGSEEHARLIGRPSSPSEVIRAVKLLRENGLRPYVYFIHGLPGQSYETVEDTVEVMEKVYEAGAEKITVYRFRSLPMSAFSSFKTAPPAVKSELSMRIVSKAREINVRSKRALIGKRLKAIVASPYHKDKSLLVAYPIKHGPVVLIKRRNSLIGRLIKVEITNVVSDRLVKGRILSSA